MDYTVIARRFRPQSFGDVIGQDRVATALRNAISAGRVAHAYLFTGARGVGKTSMARILAKTLNCPNTKAGDPCHACDICQSIAAGNDVDVLEIDGASNRGIEDVRALRSNVTVRSMRSPNKIYIIDEVHMLTREAFNALLKTLEEPPGNVKFIFCTTEPQKLPDTILSRCQRFDFGTINIESIRGALQNIAAAEQVDVAPAAIDLVARRAAGSMRDSQSLFDQLLAFGGKRVDVEDVHRLLGTAPDERLIELFDACIARQPAEVLQRFSATLASGAQLAEFTDQLLLYCRDIMVLAAGAANSEPLSVGPDRLGDLQRQATAWGLRTVLAALQILSDAKARMRGVTYGRVLAESALLRLSILADLDSLADIAVAVRTGQFANFAAAAMTLDSKPRGGLIAPAGATATAGISPGAASAGTATGGTATSPTAASSSGRGTAIAASGTKSSGQKKSDLTEKRDPTGLSADASGNGAVESVETAERANESEVAAETEIVPLEPGREAEFWDAVVRRCPGMLPANARKGVPTANSGPNHLVLRFNSSYNSHREYLEQPANFAQLEAVASAVAGRPIKLRLEADLVSPPQTKAEKRVKKEESDSRPKAPDSYVQKIADLFGAVVLRTDLVSTKRDDE